MFKNKIMPVLLTTVMVLGCNKPNKTDSPEDANNKTKLSASKIYPHSEIFNKKEHGAVYMQDRALCTTCHGTDNSGGTAQVTCTKCHATYPHVPGWTVPQKHGQIFAMGSDSNRQSCLNCHKPASTSGAITCQTCHKAFPHSEDFKGGGDNHAEMAKVYEGKCTTCHTDFKRLMPNFEPDGCATCHSDSTLSISWVNSTPPPSPDASSSPSHFKIHKEAQRGTASKPAAKKSKQIPNSK